MVGYELVVDGAHGFAGPQATAGLLLDAFGDIGLERLSGRHPASVTMTPEFLLEVGTPPVRPERVVLQLTAGPASAEVLAALRCSPPSWPTSRASSPLRAESSPAPTARRWSGPARRRAPRPDLSLAPP